MVSVVSGVMSTLAANVEQLTIRPDGDDNGGVFYCVRAI